MTDNAPPADFSLFVPDFDAPAGVIMLDEMPEPDPGSAPEAAQSAVTAEMLAAACAQAHEEGRNAGLAQAADAREAQRQAMLSALAGHIAAADTQLRDVVEESGAQLAQLVFAVLQAAFPALSARHGGAEIARLTGEMVRLLAAEPRIVIRVHPTMAGEVAQVLDRLENERRAAVVVETRDDMPPGDARVGWRHGVAVRDSHALWSQVAGILAPLGLTPPPVPAELAAAAIA